jgi:hypothetical protein
MRVKCNTKEEVILAMYVICRARIAFTNKDRTHLLPIPSVALHLLLSDLHSIHIGIFPSEWSSNSRVTAGQMSTDQTFPHEQNIDRIHIQGSQQTFIGRFENVTVPGRRETEGKLHPASSLHTETDTWD